MIEFIKTNYIFSKNCIIIKDGNKSYKWNGKGDNIEELMNSSNYIASIVHNIEEKAMIDFEYKITGESVYRCEINPASSNSEDWVVDDQF
jgi:hypothetical protein